MHRRARSSSIWWIVPLAILLLLSCNLPAIGPGVNPKETEAEPTEGDARPESGGEETEPADQPVEPGSPTSSEGQVEAPPIEELPEPSFSSRGTAPIALDETVVDENGIEVLVASESLGEGVGVELSQWDIDPNWRQAIEQNYVIEKPFVSLAASGVNDGQGRAVLRLPSAAPDSRLVMVIDNTYFSLLDVQPQGGYLETYVRMGPNEVVTEQVGSLTPGGSLHYGVLAPKSSAEAMSKGYLGKMAFQEARSCGIDMDTNFGRITHCRKSADGAVQVDFLWGIGFSDQEGDQLADAVSAAMGSYGKIGFEAAKITPQAPMKIVVETRSGDPRYRSLNGVIYLPVDAAKGMISGDVHDTLHEMAHWIQDEEYNMAWAYWSGGKTWWLETAAENMVMLHDPKYIPQNMVTYGAITTGDNRLSFQYAPYQWPGDFYAHAQLVKLNMCPNTASCPLSENTFIEAINKGTYPYDDAGAQGKVSANLDAYAQYLLGATPSSGNTVMPLEGPVVSGDGIGEYIEVAQTNKTDYRIAYNGLAPQMQTGSDGRGETVVVAATMQKDGVYPLSVSSGVNGRNPGLPFALTIQAGAPFWYRVGQDAPKYHDGSTELKLQPVHLTMGLPGVRLVALGRSGGESFQAAVSQIDLQGAWLALPGEVVSDNIVCTETQNDDTVSVSQDTQSLINFASLALVLGDMRPDPTGNSLTWEWNMARVPPDGSEYIGTVIQFGGASLPDVDKVLAQAELTVLRSEAKAERQVAASVNWPPLLLGFSALLPGIWGLRQRRKRPHLALVGLLLATLLLTGCFGLGVDMYGSIKSNMHFTELEYLGGEGVPVLGNGSVPQETPLWRLKGTAEYAVDFYMAALSEGEAAATTHCVGTATYAIETQIYKDIIVDLE